MAAGARESAVRRSRGGCLISGGRRPLHAVAPLVCSGLRQCRLRLVGGGHGAAALSAVDIVFLARGCPRRRRRRLRIRAKSWPAAGRGSSERPYQVRSGSDRRSAAYAEKLSSQRLSPRLHRSGSWRRRKRATARRRPRRARARTVPLGARHETRVPRCRLQNASANL